jgi:hypothetical protein
MNLSAVMCDDDDALAAAAAAANDDDDQTSICAAWGWYSTAAFVKQP